MSTLDQAELDRLLAEAQAQTLDNADALESFRIAHFGRQGLLKDLNERFRAVPGPQKREMGQALNAFKQALQAHFDAAKAALTAQEDASLERRGPHPSQWRGAVGLPITRFRWCGGRSSASSTAWDSLWRMAPRLKMIGTCSPA